MARTDQQPTTTGQPVTGQPAPVITETSTVEEISAALRQALTDGNSEVALNLVTALEAAKLRGARPAKPEGMSTTEVKRLVLQRMIDVVSANLPAITEGLNEREADDAVAAVSQRLSYGPGVASVTWPANFKPRTVLSNERRRLAAV